MQVVPVPLGMLVGMATLRISIPTDLRPPEARKATLLSLRARSSGLMSSLLCWVNAGSRWQSHRGARDGHAAT